jgi:phage tail sheath gpL-like
MPISTAVDPSAVARVVGIQTKYANLQAGAQFLPQRIAVVGQGLTGGSYSTTKRRVTSSTEAGEVYGFGTPVHLAVQQLLPANGDGVGSVPVTVYPMNDDGSGVAAVGTITPDVSSPETTPQAYVVNVSEVQSQQFVVSPGDTVADVTALITDAINAVLSMPVTAVDGTTEVTLTSKWKGESANDITITTVGVGNTVFTDVDPAGGLVNPAVDGALAQVGSVWETMMLNCLNISDTTALDAYSVFGEGRWGSLIHKQLVVFSGEVETDLNTAIALADSRPLDRTNSQLNGVGSNNLPFVVAARESARIVSLANSNPPYDYGSQKASGLDTGTDGEQWDYAQQDTAVKAGVSTINVVDGLMKLADTVTMYHPSGEEPPAYRYVVDIVKLQNITYGLSSIFESDEWDGAPLLNDDDPTTNPGAKRPKDAKGAVFSLLDALGLNAIIADVPFAKANTLVEIDSGNPKRLNVSITLKLSGNTNIRSIDLNFGFNFGGSAAA